MRGSRWALAFALMLVACDSGPTADVTVAAPSTTAEHAVITTAATGTTIASEPEVPSGTWEGALVDPQSSFEARLMIQGCEAIGDVCGELEYMDPVQPDLVLCAPTLVYLGTEGEQFVFEEQPAFRPAECFPMTLKMSLVDDTTMTIDQYPEPDNACCTGDFHQVSDTVAPSTPPPGMTLEGLEGPISATDLHGATTQYTAAGTDAMWFPIGGALQRLDPGTGEITATIEAGDPTSDLGDPYSVAVDEGAVWAAQLVDRSIVRFDEASGEQVDSIDVDFAPYAMALDGSDLWVSSFDDSVVVRVDISSGKQTASIEVDSPTGIAVGGGAVWVVAHRSDTLERIDPATNQVTATIELGGPGDDPICSMCVENVVFAHGSVWTANNAGRSITRVDPASNEPVLIPLEHRPWAVTATDDSVWASQFEGIDGTHIDREVGGVARVDPASNVATQVEFPGTLSVASGHGSLWIVTLGRRSDLVYQYTPVG